MTMIVFFLELAWVAELEKNKKMFQFEFFETFLSILNAFSWADL